MFIEIDEFPATRSALCLFKKDVTFKISIPKKHKNKYIIKYEDKTDVIYGDRIIKESNNLIGGQGVGVEYRIKGQASIRMAVFDNGALDCGFLHSTDNNDGIFVGPILSFESFTIPSNSIYPALYIRVVSEGGNRITEKETFWIFNARDMSDECLLAYEGSVPEGDYLPRFVNPKVGKDSVSFSHWEPVNDTLANDLLQHPFEQLTTIKIYDCNDQLIYNKRLKNVKVVTEESGYDDPVFLTVPLWYLTYAAIRKQEIVENGVSRKCVVIWSSQPLNNQFILNIDVPVLEPPILGFQFVPVDWTLIDKFCSPECSDKFPKVAYSCDCESECPPNTVCSIQQDDQVLCLDSKGCVIASLDVGCITPDYTC